MTSFLQKLGITTPDPPKEEQVPSAAAASPPIPPASVMGITSTGATTTFAPLGVQVDESIYNAIMSKIANVDVNYSAFRLQRNNMLSAKLDEATAYKAAAAAASVGVTTLTASIEVLKGAVAAEKASFEANDLAVMNKQCKDLEDIASLDQKKIEDLTTALQEAVAHKASVEADLSAKRNEVAMFSATFDATIGKVLADIETEQRKLTAFLPKEG